MNKYTLVQFNNDTYGVKKSSWFSKDSYKSTVTDGFLTGEEHITAYCTMTLDEAKAQLRFIRNRDTRKVLPSKELTEDE